MHYDLYCTPRDENLPVYMLRIGIQHHQEENNRVFPHYHILITSKGKGAFHCGQHHFTLNTGSVLFVAKDMLQHYYAVGKEFETHWLAFDGAAFPALMDALGLPDCVCFSCDDHGRLLQQHRAMLQYVQKHPVGYSRKLSSLLYDFIVSVAQAYERTQQTNPRLQVALKYMHEHYACAISLDELAAQTGMTRFSFCRAFKQCYRITALDYLQKIRIQQAKFLLIEAPELSVWEIAKMTGFSSISYFDLVFKRNENITPREFRLQNK